jgi:cytochrome c-type biogenesis protein CcmF
VLLGTLYPLFLDALGMGKISVGPPYFDTVFALLMAPLVLVMGVGPLTRWKSDEAGPLARRLALPLVLALAAALAVGWSAGHISPATTGGLTMAFWIVFTLLSDLKPRLLPPGGSIGQVLHRAGMVPLAMWGMMLAHFGVAAFAFGVAMVKTYETEKDVKMGPGDTTEVAGYVFKMNGFQEAPGPNYSAMRGQMEVSRDGKLVAVLRPEKRIYRVQQNPMTEAGVESNLWRDLYVSMGEQLPGGEWVVRVQYKPFIVWTWGGCLLMMAGGILAASDRRYRSRQSATSPASSGPVEAVA